MTFLRPTKDLNKLYYYCSLSTALEYILPFNQLLLSPLIKTNDPRENKAMLFSYYSIREEPVDLNHLNSKFSQIIRDDCKVLCFSQDYRKYQGCQLSKMWAHYGENHHGVCLEINKSEFIKENRAFIDDKLFKPISYYEYDNRRRPNQPSINLVNLRKHDNEIDYIKSVVRKDHLDYLFFTKGNEWESESEYRLIHFSSTQEKEYCSIQSSLEYIHLGVDFNDVYLPSVKEVAGQREIYKMFFLQDALICGRME